MISETKWYCSRCGKEQQVCIESDLPDYYNSLTDKQWIVTHVCSNCKLKTLVYRNAKEVVQICQRYEPINEYYGGKQ